MFTSSVLAWGLVRKYSCPLMVSTLKNPLTLSPGRTFGERVAPYFSYSKSVNSLTRWFLDYFPLFGNKCSFLTHSTIFPIHSLNLELYFRKIGDGFGNINDLIST